MARWKARAKFLLSAIELLFLSLTVEALRGKMCQNSLPSGVGRSLGAKISGGRGRPPANILIPLERQLIALQLWMVLWKARVEFLLSVIELLFLSLTVEVLQGKMCENSLPSGGGGLVLAKISGTRGHPPASILIPLERQLIALQLCR